MPDHTPATAFNLAPRPPYLSTDASSDYAAGLALGAGWEVGANARCLTTHLPLLSASPPLQLVRQGGGLAEGRAMYSTHSTAFLS